MVDRTLKNIDWLGITVWPLWCDLGCCSRTKVVFKAVVKTRLWTVWLLVNLGECNAHVLQPYSIPLFYTLILNPHPIPLFYNFKFFIPFSYVHLVSAISTVTGYGTIPLFYSLECMYARALY